MPAVEYSPIAPAKGVARNHVRARGKAFPLPILKSHSAGIDEVEDSFEIDEGMSRLDGWPKDAHARMDSSFRKDYFRFGTN